MVRVKQFADDLGISKNKAQALINKGRSRKDGGSQILENVMKPKGYLAGGSIASSVKKDSKKIKKTDKKPEDPMGNMFGKDKEIKIRPEAQAPYHSEFNPDQYHEKLNPKGTKGRPKVLPKNKKDAGMDTDFKNVKKTNKKKDGGFPDLTGDGKVTQKDILKGRGVPGFSRGGGMAIQGLGFRGVK
jgi:hypothetical protein